MTEIDKATAQLRIMRALKIGELSAVNKPAQEGARALLIKTADTAPLLPVLNKDEGLDAYVKRFTESAAAKTAFPDEAVRARAAKVAFAEQARAEGTIEKSAAMTTDVDGHAHIVTLDYGNGELSFGNSDYSVGPEPNANHHSHPWVRLEDGSIVVGMADGHTHAIAQISKTQDGAERMDPETKKKSTGEGADEVTVAKSDFEKMQARLDRAEAIAALTSTRKAHYDALDTDEAKDAFLAKTAADQDADVEQAAEIAKGDVVYKDADGNTYTKKDDPRLIANAKRADKALRESARNAAIAKRAELAKRAGEILKNFPKDEDVHVAVLNAIDGIENEEHKKAAFELLKAGNDALDAAFVRKGTKKSRSDAEDPTVDDAPDFDAFDKRAEEIMREVRKGGEEITYEQAYEKALLENPKAYAEAIGLVEVSAEEASRHYD